MTREKQFEVAQSRWGRVQLHARALLRDGKWFWHLRGMIREFVGRQHL